ncbi:MAG: T9SS type A sorting domain-containing protein [Bacteroidota bacterium]
MTAVSGNTYYILVENTITSDVVFSEPALPVELVDFAGTTDGNRAHLAWQTASETNNAGFQIEHSTSASDWASLGFTPGHGTTLNAQRYSYTVDGLIPGTHRFRLKQIDYDGTFDYSPEVEVSVEMAESFVLSEVYPNPFNPEASVMLSVRERQQVTVTVHDLLGREVARLFDGELAAQQGQVLRLNGSQWTSGLYVLRAVGERFSASQTITLLK